jgi:hypothetical protein
VLLGDGLTVDVGVLVGVAVGVAVGVVVGVAVAGAAATSGAAARGSAELDVLGEAVGLGPVFTVENELPSLDS